MNDKPKKPLAYDPSPEAKARRVARMFEDMKRAFAAAEAMHAKREAKNERDQEKSP